jgi:hypothetical protein
MYKMGRIVWRDTIVKFQSFIAVMGVIASSAIAAEPILRRITPAGLSAGHARTINLYGERLGDATAIQFYEPGLKATKFEVVADNHLKVEIESDAQLPNKLHAFRLVTKTGLSNLRYLGVNRNPAVDEVEPNSDFAVPQVVSLQSTIDGTVRNEDVDYFAVDLKEGQIISVELEGMQHAADYNFFDTSVSIYNSERFEVVSCDDSALLRQDCICSYKATKDGRYVIEVREAAYAGSDDCLYRLHISSQTRPISVIPAGGQPGEILSATLIDDLGNSWQESFQLPSTPNEKFAIWSQRDGQMSPSPNYVKVIAATHQIESEPNGDPTKVAISPNGPAMLYGVLQTPNDEDYFVFHAVKDQQFEIKSTARSLMRSPADTVINVFKLNGPHIAGNDDSQGPDAFVDFKAPEDADYAIRVRDHLGRGGVDFAYCIEVLPKVATVFPTIVDQERLVAQTLVIPRGTRAAIEVNVNRRYIGGPAEIKLDGLPEGVTFEPLVCPENYPNVPVIVYAKEDAPLTSALADMTTSIKSGENLFTGHLVQRTQLIRAQNDRDVWGYDANRVAIAVTEAAPFDIEVVQPQVPLLRDGSLDVQVKLRRKEGFNEPVGLRFLYNAPGMSANGSVVFAKDQTEAVVPVTANGNARLGVSTFSILAWAGTNVGTVRIASKPFTIEIADRLFDFAFNKSMAEQGKPIDVLIGAQIKRQVEGKIELEVLGVPPGTTCDVTKVAFDPAGTQIVYKLNVAADAKPGSYKTIACRAIVTSDKGVMMQTNGNGEVQIDIPLPAATTPAPAAEATPVAQTEQPAAPKVLTRLEQLRAMREKK